MISTDFPVDHSPLLADAGFAHAFFTRLGGVSAAPFDTLNFAVSVGDEAANVAENMRRAAAHLGVAPQRLYYLSQVHGSDSLRLTSDLDAAAVRAHEGDITYSDDAAVACGVRMADCAPVLLADRRTGAVAAVHSGWRGTVKGAAAAGVKVLRELIGGVGDVVAAVGPHIEVCCFEVGADVAAQIAAAAPEVDGVVVERQPRPHVDLRRVIAAQLRRVGVVQVEQVRGCTMCDGARYHSFRRAGAVSGRMLAAIVPRAAGAPRRVAIFN
ncbi:MAG TPA: peptidoglycan editing factor PgeF [Sorangium sp.]|nr:peptidoglycan editing factor PgeF [Sorangium sp.]